MLYVPKRSVNHDFFSVWSPSMAYVLGFFAADGTMRGTKRGGHYLEFHITDREILVMIREVMGSDHCLSERAGTSGHKTLYRLQVGSKKLYADLIKLGFTDHKSKSMHFPSVPKEYISDFVRGYFDGDGCIYFRELHYADRKHKRKVMLTLFTSGSLKFLERLHEVLRGNGIKGGSIQSKQRGYSLNLSHRDSLALYTFLYNTMDSQSLFLGRKYKLFTKAISTLYPAAGVA